MHRTSKKAFTLVELLVVFGIIVLLVGIILPALARAREMGRRAVCLSNIRQLTAAWLMYAGENRGHICCAKATPFSWNNGVTRESFLWGWLAADSEADSRVKMDRVQDGILWTYLRSRNVYLCPSDPQTLQYTNPNGTSNGQQALTPIAGATGHSYSMNALLGAFVIQFGSSVSNTYEAAGLSQPVSVIYTISQIKHPPQMFVFIETADRIYPNAPASANHAEFIPPVYPLAEGLYRPQQPGQFHRMGSSAEGCTISFADGHAIFWQYGGPDVGQEWATAGGGNIGGPDVLQLAAWGGGPVPPGVTP